MADSSVAHEEAYRVVTAGLVVHFDSLEGAARWVTDTLRAGRAYRIERRMGGEWVLALGHDGANASLGAGL